MTNREIERILQEEPNEEKVAAAVREYRAEHYAFVEDKLEICNALLQTLRLTRDGRDISYIVYENSPMRREEIVTLEFNDGNIRKINVTADSGTALIRDVLKALA